MLSTDMRNTAGALRDLIARNRLTPQMVIILADRLDDLARQAGQLEAAAIAPAAQLAGHNLPDNVVRIAAILARKGVHVGAALGPNGGDAA